MALPHLTVQVPSSLQASDHHAAHEFTTCSTMARTTEESASSTTSWCTAIGPSGRWLLQATQMGHGMFGTVHHGFDMLTGELVAIKRQALGRSEEVSNEVSAMARLAGCANVIGYRAHFEDSIATSIVMDLATGGELFEQVASEKLGMAEEVARGIFAQMASGVEQMHSRGVAHRDLKLENAVLEANGTVRWIDFGLAHLYPEHPSGTDPGTEYIYTGTESHFCPSEDLIADEHLVGTAVGSEAYMSPELKQLLNCCASPGFRGVDPRKADIWALGVCLFAMVAGFFPLGADRNREAGQLALAALCAASREGRCGVSAIYASYGRACLLSKPLVALLNALLSVDPNQRPAASDICASAWLSAHGARRSALLASDAILPAAASPPSSCSSGIAVTTPRQPCSPLPQGLPQGSRPREHIAKKRGRRGEPRLPKRSERRTGEDDARPGCSRVPARQPCAEELCSEWRAEPGDVDCVPALSIRHLPQTPSRSDWDNGWRTPESKFRCKERCWSLPAPGWMAAPTLETGSEAVGEEAVHSALCALEAAGDADVWSFMSLLEAEQGAGGGGAPFTLGA